MILILDDGGWMYDQSYQVGIIFLNLIIDHFSGKEETNRVNAKMKYIIKLKSKTFAFQAHIVWLLATICLHLGKHV